MIKKRNVVMRFGSMLLLFCTFLTACSKDVSLVPSPTPANSKSVSLAPSPTPVDSVLATTGLSNEISIGGGFRYSDYYAEFIDAFKAEHPDVKFRLEHPAPDRDTFDPLADLKGIVIDRCPDVIVTGYSDDIKDIIEMQDTLEDLSQKAEEISKDMIPFTLDIGKDKSGKLRALTSSVFPYNSFIYKKEVAKKYLGTDQPEDISQMLSTPEKILETAKKLKEKSRGKVALFPSHEELYYMFMSIRSEAWVKDGKLNIDEKIFDYIDFSKKLKDNGYLAAKDLMNHEKIRVMISSGESALFRCSYNVHSLERLAEWGTINTSFPSFDGGPWFAISTKCKNKELAWEFVRFITSDKEYLAKKISFPNSIQLIGERTANIDQFNEQIDLNDGLDGYEKSVDKLIGESFYSIDNTSIFSINGKLKTEYDDVLRYVFQDALGAYLQGKYKTKEELIQKFKEKAKEEFKTYSIYSYKNADIF